MAENFSCVDLAEAFDIDVELCIEVGDDLCEVYGCLLYQIDW